MMGDAFIVAMRGALLRLQTATAMLREWGAPVADLEDAADLVHLDLAAADDNWLYAETNGRMR